MERLSRYAVMPVRGEIDANILEFEDVYGVAFGAVGTVNQTFGHKDRQAENAGVVCIHFKTGNRTETNVGFGIFASMMEAALGINRDTIISNHPWAFRGEDGNIIETGDDTKGTCTTFLSGDGVDPRGPTTKQGYIQGPSGYQMGTIEVPARTGGLKPDTDYWVTYRRTNRTDGNLPPISLKYYGSDDPEHGGEVLIDLPDPVAPVTGGGEAMRFTLGELKGVFIPD